MNKSKLSVVYNVKQARRPIENILALVDHFQIPQTSILNGCCIIMSKTELLTNLEIGALIVWGFMPYHWYSDT